MRPEYVGKKGVIQMTLLGLSTHDTLASYVSTLTAPLFNAQSSQDGQIET